MAFITDLISSIQKMPWKFADVAMQGSTLDSAILIPLMLLGAIMVAIPSLALGYLTLGAMVELIVPDSGDVSHP